MALEVTLGEMLGKGSYGMVYNATTQRHGDVAVKVLPWAPHEVSSDRKRELKMLQRCNSAYIVRAYGAFAKPKELWICMEYLDLGSLLDVMRSMDEPLPEDAIATAVCDSSAVAKGTDGELSDSAIASLLEHKAAGGKLADLVVSGVSISAKPADASASETSSSST